jgi:hypothetical protein
MEMSIFFQELLPRLQTIELAGNPQRTIGNFVGGPKSVPIRFTLAAAASCRGAGDANRADWGFAARSLDRQVSLLDPRRKENE